jgi:WD40 repeat protein
LGGDGELRLWSLEDGASTGRLIGHVERAWCMTYSPDGHQLVTTGGEGTVRMWDIEAWSERTILSGPRKSPRTLVFSPDDETLTVFDFIGGEVTWNVATGAVLKSDIPPPPEQEVFSAVSADGQRLAIAKNQPLFIDVFSHSHREPLARLEQWGRATHILALSRDGSLLAVFEETGVGSAGTLRVLNVETGKEICRGEPVAWSDGMACLAWSPAGTRLAVRTHRGPLLAWNLEGGALSRAPVEFAESWNTECKLAFSPDGALLATSGPERTIAVLDSETLEPWATLVNHTGAVYGLDFSPDGLTLASASADGTVRLWNVATGQELLRLDGHSGPVRRVRFSHAGRTLASAAETPSGGSEVILWRASLPTRE